MPMGSSPLTRGFAQKKVDDINAQGFIPAYAGVCRERRRVSAVVAVHPRLRGGLVRTGSRSCQAAGSSPLTRGFDCSRGGGVMSQRFIPAYAGVCYAALPLVRSAAVHPRLRGGLLTELRQRPLNLGSSPLTRGFGKRINEPKYPHGFIPAYAGVCVHQDQWIM